MQNKSFVNWAIGLRLRFGTTNAWPVCSACIIAAVSGFASTGCGVGENWTFAEQEAHVRVSDVRTGDAISDAEILYARLLTDEFTPEEVLAWRGKVGGMTDEAGELTITIRTIVRYCNIVFPVFVAGCADDPNGFQGDLFAFQILKGEEKDVLSADLQDGVAESGARFRLEILEVTSPHEPIDDGCNVLCGGDYVAP